VAALLTDSPPAPPGDQAPPDGSAGTPAGPAAGSAPAASAERTCAKCGATLAADQDWCLQCGAGAPGSIGTPSWRSATAVLGATAILALGAAAAAYAALSEGSSKPRAVTATIAQATVPTSTTPGVPATPGAAATPSTTAPAIPGTASTPKTSIAPLLGGIKPPKIPLTALTPKAPNKSKSTPSSGALGTGALGTGTSAPTSTSTTPSSPSSGGSSASGEASQPTAIVLDTNAASSYNPYNYPASDFGDPSLAIDGSTATAWTAMVNPVVAPRMAVGLLIDLKAKQQLSALELVTSTPGMTVQVYGSNSHAAPPSITDPAWIPLSPSEVVKKKHLRISLRKPSSKSSTKAFTFVTLWVSRAPASSTPWSARASRCASSRSTTKPSPRH